LELKQLAEEFSMTEEELTRQGLRAFLVDRLRLLDAERRTRCARFGVESLEEMDTLVRQGRVEEEDILEDLQQVDYLTARIERIRQILESLS
jgi:hypothetical protein